MNRLADSRDRIFNLLSGVVMSAWHVHQYIPPQVVTPCVWIDSYRASWSTERARFVTVAWNVNFLADGDDEQQLVDLDEIVARAWDALDRPAERLAVESVDNRSIDIGGPFTRAAVLTVNANILAATLCPNGLVTTGSTP